LVQWGAAIQALQGGHISPSPREGAGGRGNKDQLVDKSKREVVNWDSRKCSPTQHKCRDLLRQKFFS
jgi:hypothetical protein